MMNHITLIGRMTKDPELRYTQSNVPVASFTLAVERDIKSNGEKQTDFIPCVSWRQAAEFVSKYFKKGSMAAVSGRLQMRDWTDNDGNKRRVAEVVTENIYFCEKKETQNGEIADDKLDRLKDYGVTFEEEEDIDGELPF